MQYIGIDLHKKFSHVTILGEDGKIKDSRRIDNREEALVAHFNNFDEPSKAVVEATFSWGWMTDMLERQHIDVVLAHPQKVKAIGSAQIKTDKIDAEVLATTVES